MEELIARTGYPAVFLLTFFEGETVVALAGFAAHRGWLSLEGVIATAFLATFLSDQIYFHVGRRYGPRLLQRFPSWQRPAERARKLLDRYDTLFILGFRFVYGLRTISPFIIGTSSVSGARFLVLNAIAALLWAIAFSTLGYAFGNVLELIIGDIERIEEVLFEALAAAALSYIAWRWYRRRGRQHSAPPDLISSTRRRRGAYPPQNR